MRLYNDDSLDGEERCIECKEMDGLHTIDCSRRPTDDDEGSGG